MTAERQKSLPDLAAWVDSRQSQGLYFLTREEALRSLRQSDSAFKQAAARHTSCQEKEHP